MTGITCCCVQGEGGSRSVRRVLGITTTMLGMLFLDNESVPCLRSWTQGGGSGNNLFRSLFRRVGCWS